jgi:hypothetical protein
LQPLLARMVAAGPPARALWEHSAVFTKYELVRRLGIAAAQEKRIREDTRARRLKDDGQVRDATYAALMELDPAMLQRQMEACFPGHKLDFS